jgi:hypothetical protein
MKRLLLAILAAALLGGCTDKSDYGRFQIHESTVDIYSGPDPKESLHAVPFKLLIKTDTVTGKAWYWSGERVNGKETANEWILLGEGVQPTKEDIRKTLFGDE